MIDRILLAKYLEGGRKEQKILDTILIVVRNNSRMSRLTVDIIRQIVMELSISNVVFNCKYP